jgi:hypothetical protein
MNKNSNEIELYLDTLGVLKKLWIENYTDEESLKLESCVTNYLHKHINVLLNKEIFTEALQQDLIYLQSYKLSNQTERLNLSCFTDDIFIVDVLLKYVGNIVIDVYCGTSFGSSTKLGSIKLQQLKSLIYTHNELL